MHFVVCYRPWHLPGCSGGIGSERPMTHRVYKRVNAVLSDKVEKQVNERWPSVSSRGKYQGNAATEDFLEACRKNAFARESTELGIWPRSMCSIRFKRFTTERVVTVTWAASVLMPSKVPQFEAEECLLCRG